MGCHALLQGIVLTQTLNPGPCGSCIACRFFTTGPSEKLTAFCQAHRVMRSGQLGSDPSGNRELRL